MTPNEHRAAAERILRQVAQTLDQSQESVWTLALTVFAAACNRAMSRPGATIWTSFTFDGGRDLEVVVDPPIGEKGA